MQPKIQTVLSQITDSCIYLPERFSYFSCWKYPQELQLLHLKPSYHLNRVFSQKFTRNVKNGFECKGKRALVLQSKSQWLDPRCWQLFLRRPHNLKQSSEWFDVYLVTVKSSRRVFQIFVVFSECLKFNLDNNSWTHKNYKTLFRWPSRFWAPS